MKRHAPEVRQYMSHLPVEAERCETIADAVELMRAHGIHHLPVMSGSHLKGIVSLRDLLSMQNSQPKDAANLSLGQVCQTEVLKVSPVTPIDDVARQMLQFETDGAVVTDGGFVVGIFTTTDVLRFITDMFGQT